ANPDERLLPKVGLPAQSGAIGVLTITPSEAAIIAADVATKAAGVELGFVDRFSGSVVVLGRLTDVESAVENVVAVLCDQLGFARPPLTRT
ncbi:MAG: BMC domain-containing protein, partial [Propionicimonas sp.]